MVQEPKGICVHDLAAALWGWHRASTDDPNQTLASIPNRSTLARQAGHSLRAQNEGHGVASGHTRGRVGLSAENPVKGFELAFSASDIRLLE